MLGEFHESQGGSLLLNTNFWRGATLMVMTALLLISLIGQGRAVRAQDDGTPTPQPIVPLAVRSGRYAMTVPTGWYASLEPLFANLQVLPSEVMTLADSEATVNALAEDSEFNTLEINNLEGAILLATIWPGNLLTGNALTGDTFEADFAAQLTDQYTDTLREAVELRGIEGRRYTYTAEGGVHSWVYFLNDPNGHLMMIFAASDDAHQADITTTLDSLTYFAFSADDLLNLEAARYPVTVIPGVVAIEIPLGWWILPGDGSLQAVASSPQTVEFAGPVFSNASGEVGIVIVALQVNRPAIDLSTPTGDATPSAPITAEEIATEMATLIFNTESSRVQSVAAWQNEAPEDDPDATPFSGWLIELTTDLGNKAVFVYVLMVEDGDKLNVLGAITDAENAPDYAPLIESIFATTQRPG